MKSSVSFRGEKLEKRKRQRMRRRRMCWKQMMWFWSPAWSCRTCPPLLRFLASVLSNKIFKLFQFPTHPIYTLEWREGERKTWTVKSRTYDFLKISNLPISQSGFIHNIVKKFDGNLTGLDYVESWLLPGLFRQIIIPSNLTLNFDYVHELEA